MNHVSFPTNYIIYPDTSKSMFAMANIKNKSKLWIFTFNVKFWRKIIILALLNTKQFD
jgi:hypothetical protein